MPAKRLPIRLALLTTDNPKTAKGASRAVLTGVLHLLPADEYLRLATEQGHDVVTLRTTCPFAGACAIGCLNTAGRGGIPTRDAGVFLNPIQRARYNRTRLLDMDAPTFVATLIADIRRLAAYARKHGYDVAIRLDGTSDLALDIRYPEIARACADEGAIRYDYTKDATRAIAGAAGVTAAHYTYSLDRGAARMLAARRVLSAGGNVAVVFRVRKGRELPAMWNGYNVVDGDVTDLRYLDPRGVIVGLRAKGRAVRDTSGFVVDI